MKCGCQIFTRLKTRQVKAPYRGNVMTTSSTGGHDSQASPAAQPYFFLSRKHPVARPLDHKPERVVKVLSYIALE